MPRGIPAGTIAPKARCLAAIPSGFFDGIDSAPLAAST